MPQRKHTASNLPPFSKAFHFALKCLDLTRIRDGKTTDPGGVLRQRMHRFFRAKSSDDDNGRGQEFEGKLYSALRCHAPEEFGHAYAVAEEAVISLLCIYRDLIPRLDAKGYPVRSLMWLLAEHVVAPTLMLIFARHRGAGLGLEFDGGRTWYLPGEMDGQILAPFARVFEFWMRTAGCPSTNGLAAELIKISERPGSQDALRKKLERCRNGSFPPTLLAELFETLEPVQERTSWLGDPSEWRARFFLAAALQRFFVSADNYFVGIHPNPSQQISAWVRTFSRERMFMDDGQLLGNPTTFYAERLWCRKVLHSKPWARTIKRKRQFGPKATNAEVQQWKQSTETALKPGNRLAEFLRNEVMKTNSAKSEDACAPDGSALRDYLVGAGVREIEQLMREKQAK